MKLIFDYPQTLDSLDLMLATKAYADIWEQDGTRIVDALERYTGLRFQQDEIHVVIHDGQSWSGMDGKPMRLNMRNYSLVEKRNALIHELGHRLLFGNGLYAPDEEEPDGDEFRVFLFQGDVLKELYGLEAYDFWASTDPALHTAEHIRPVTAVLALTPEERREKIRAFAAAPDVPHDQRPVPPEPRS